MNLLESYRIFIEDLKNARNRNDEYHESRIFFCIFDKKKVMCKYMNICILSESPTHYILLVSYIFICCIITSNES